VIGESDGGCCGDEWETWGISWSWDEDDEGNEISSFNKQQIPPYEADGFTKEHLNNLSDLQICRTDEPGNYHQSSTVSFKRQNK
jgi:hypothetical protein